MSPRIRLASGVRWSGPVVLGIVAVIAIVSMGIAGFVRVGSAMFAPSADPSAENAFEDLLSQHDATLAINRKRFDGRSAFFMPSPPAPPPPPPPPPSDVKEKDPGPPPEPPPPMEYTGSKVIACIGGSVYLADGSRVAIGEEKNGVRVVATNPPWDVTLHHLKKDYVVSTLPDSTESFLGGSISSFGSSTPGMESPSSVRGAAATPKTNTPPKNAGAAPPVVKQPDGRTLPAEETAPHLPAAGSPPAPDAPANAAAPSGEPQAGDPAHAAAADAPPAFTKAQIDQMDRTTLTQAMATVSRSRLNRSLDEATRTRLNQEFAWMQARIKSLPR